MSQPSKVTGPIQLLPRTDLVKTGVVDHADWNYKPILGQIQRLRFKLVRKLLNGKKIDRLLEIGYGSGVFMPELDQHCEDLYGIDVHPHPEDVAKVLSAHGVWPHLVTGSATELPYDNDFFDAIVAVGAIEFIPDLGKACAEFRRVLAPGGVVIIITPGRSPMVDFGLKLLTGQSAKNDFADRRAAILPCLHEHFREDRRIDAPWLVHHVVKLYTALELSDPTKRPKREERKSPPVPTKIPTQSRPASLHPQS